MLLLLACTASPEPKESSPPPVVTESYSGGSALQWSEGLAISPERHHHASLTSQRQLLVAGGYNGDYLEDVAFWHQSDGVGADYAFA
jgi:hypothetical protein